MTIEQITAREIVIKMQFQKEPLNFEQAKYCAKISVENILQFLKLQMGFYDEKGVVFWESVMNEIEKL